MVIKSRVIGVHNFTRLKRDNFSIPVILKKVPGIVSAKLDEDKGKLYVVYDLDRTSYDDIEKVLDMIGCARDDTLWQHLRDSFIRFVEENERAHLEAHADTFDYSRIKGVDELLDTED
ncbi:hypothetical protein J7L01_04075 [bacterium]|nr:hypothetical protein [bacterium]